jgi:periplasmic protein TonB
MPTLGPAGPRRIPLAPKRRIVARRRPLEWSLAVSLCLHVAVLLYFIINIPLKPPPEATPSPAVDVVFEGGEKKTSAPKGVHGPPQRAREAAPQGAVPRPPSRIAERAAPAPEPLPQPPAPAPPAPTPPTPTPPTPPKPRPAPKPAAAPKTPPLPKPVPTPPLPQIKLPPPPPLPPAPVPPPAPPVETEQPEVNLALPPEPPLPELPTPPPPQPPAPPLPRLARRAPSRRNTLGGGVMMNGLSFNGGGSLSGGRSTRGLNLSLDQSEAPANGADLAITGAIGADWRAAFAQWVEDHKYYPPGAGMLGQEGRVVVHFTVDRAGHVSALSFVGTSGYALLDQAWLGLFRGADLPPFPAGTKADSVGVTASMHYEIIRP